MKNRSQHIVTDSILISFLQKQTSEKEEKIIQAWLLNSPENQSYFEKLRTIWEQSISIIDFDLIDAEGDLNIVKSKIESEGNKPKTKELHFRLYAIARIAAVFIIMLGIALLTKYFLVNDPEMLVHATEVNQSEVVLSDGSKVFLNQHSTLTYPEKFTNKERVVSLNGEAYFEVEKNKKTSFIVRAGSHGTVEVLGTSFNIKADTSNVTVHVTTGKVAFYQDNKSDDRTILIKNQQAVLENETISKNDISDPNFLSWKTGLLEFRNSPLSMVVEQLTNYYKQPIKIDKQSIGAYKYTSTIDNQSLEEVLDEIKLVFNLDYILKSDTIIIYPNQ